jgi:hypothetical protein
VDRERYLLWRHDIFDHEPQSDVSTWWDETGGESEETLGMEAESRWLPDLDELIKFITHLCANAKSELVPFSQRQVGDGLWYLVASSTFLQNVLSGPRNEQNPSWRERPPLKARLECIRSTYQLFTEYLGPQYHRQSTDRALKQTIGYWWEFFPLPNPAFVDLDGGAFKPMYIRGDTGSSPAPAEIAESQAYIDEVLGVMERLLELRDPAFFDPVLRALPRWYEPTGKARALEEKFADR